MTATDVAEKRLRARADYLFAHGWRQNTEGQWQHPKLGFPWPGSFAVMLEREADEGDEIALALLERDR